jgi:hypothetical protein
VSSNEEMLKGTLTKVEIESVGSVQRTEKDCIISPIDLKTHATLITECTSLRDRTVQFLDVEKTITNVTIKDASYVPFNISSLETPLKSLVLKWTDTSFFYCCHFGK